MLFEGKVGLVIGPAFLLQKMSRPNIALHKPSIVMEELKTEYLKRSQKDYSMSFKLQVVSEIERGECSTTGAVRKYGIQARSTVVAWLRKYGTFDWENQTPSNMPKSKDQKILELEQKIRLLEKQKAFLAKQAEDSNKKAIFFDMMIDIAEKEFNIPIPKKLLTRTIDRFTRENKVSKTSTCGLLGVSRQVYYRSVWSKQKSQTRVTEVVSMVAAIRRDMLRIGFRKLYYLLYKPLKEFGVGRNKFLSILKANHMLIKPKRNYRITTDSHHRFRKYENLIENLPLKRPEQVWVSDITYIGG